jgi:hypothetical protein
MTDFDPIGWTIVEAFDYDDGEYHWPRFVLEKDGERVYVEVSRDDEGNGPGTLFISDEEWKDEDW